MYRKFLSYLTILLALFCTSCSQKQYQVLFEKQNALSADSSRHAPAVTLDQYLIQPQDVLQIRNLQNIDILANSSTSGSGGSSGGDSQSQTFCLSQGAVLLTGNHNYKKTTFDLIVSGFTLEDGAWIGACAVVNPGVTVADHAVSGPLHQVHIAPSATWEPYAVYQGNPATKTRERVIGESL